MSQVPVAIGDRVALAKELSLLRQHRSAVTGLQ